jgi:hypothetical protein
MHDLAVIAMADVLQDCLADDPVVFGNSNCKWLCAAGSMDRCS